MIECIAIAHSSVLVADCARALHFYCDVLGLRVNSARPDLGYPGAWLNIGNGQIHLLQLAEPASTTPHVHPNRDRHVALWIKDIDAAERTLKTAGYAFNKSRSGRRALFCRDPDGNGIELIELSV